MASCMDFECFVLLFVVVVVCDVMVSFSCAWRLQMTVNDVNENPSQGRHRFM